MPTKAELEKELTTLRAELAALKAKAPHTSDAREGIAGLADSLGSADLDALVRQLTDEIEQTIQHRPLVTVLGAFLVGYVAGRFK